MSTGAIVGIIIAVVVVAAIVVLGPSLTRQVRMRRQFGPEYDRLAKELGPVRHHRAPGDLRHWDCWSCLSSWA